MELKLLMRDSGLVGAGGAGFPSYAKLAGGADTLLINGAECEPLLYTDYIILKNEPELVLEGINTILDHLEIPRALLAIKAHTAKRLGLSDGERLADRISVRVLGDVYPTGDEISLIKEAIDRTVNPGKLPITVGVIVYNVETMYNLGALKRYGRPVIEKWLTVGGNIPSPTVVKVPIGIKVSELLKALNVEIPEGHTVVDGGPSMGKIINPATAVINKTTKGILILPDSSAAISSKLINEKMAVARAETACCQCTRCTDMCPRHLLGYPLEPHKMVRTAMGAAKVDPKMVINATLCCGCGICETLACSQGISPKAVINNYKALLRQNGIRYLSEEKPALAPEREYRRIPSERWAQALGIARFDRVAVFDESIGNFKYSEINLSSHIGLASVPVVSDGDTVRQGDMIAEGGDGLSVAQHAPFDGVCRVLGNKIIITKI